MSFLDFGRYALSIFAAPGILAGCGGSQPPIGAPGAMPQSRETMRWIDNSAPAYKTSAPLLFVVNFDSPPYDAVAIYNARVNNPNPIAVINVKLPGFRGHFPLCGEGSTNGQETSSRLSLGVPV
jgi:hypothetical protein